MLETGLPRDAPDDAESPCTGPSRVQILHFRARQERTILNLCYMWVLACIIFSHLLRSLLVLTDKLVLCTRTVCPSRDDA